MKILDGCHCISLCGHFLALEDGVVLRFHKLPASTARCMLKKNSLKLLIINVFDLNELSYYSNRCLRIGPLSRRTPSSFFRASPDKGSDKGLKI